MDTSTTPTPSMSWNISPCFRRTLGYTSPRWRLPFSCWTEWIRKISLDSAPRFWAPRSKHSAYFSTPTDAR